MQVLVVQPQDDALPKETADQLSQIGCEVSTAGDYESAMGIIKECDVSAVLLSEPQKPGCTPEHQVAFEFFIKHIEAKRIATILYSNRVNPSDISAPSLIEHVKPNISTSELQGRLSMIGHYHNVVRGLGTQLQHMEQLGKLLNQHLREMDQEMELAGRLQQDFLPKRSGRIGSVEYATLYRPVTWISGDMFDVIPIDDDHLGLYVADAVGHGMASGLLAMYMKRTIVPRRVEHDNDIIVNPSEVMSTLNRAMVDQALPDCQFVTACYALVNHQTRTFKFSRAGHPYPILIKKNGDVKELTLPGGLLGLNQKEEFPTLEISMNIGDKVLIFTDGIEPVIRNNSNNQSNDELNVDLFRSMAPMNVHDMIVRIESTLEGEAGWNIPPDDITVVGIEMTE